MASRAVSLLDPPPPGLDPYATIDPDHPMEVVRFQAQDKVSSSGVLHLPKEGRRAELVVVQAHPDGDMALDGRFPSYARAGIAGLALRHRYVKDDQNLIMEEIMLVLAATIRYLTVTR